MEIPTIPKAVLDNLLESIGNFREPPRPHLQQNDGFPLFHGTSLRPPAPVVPSQSLPLPGGSGGGHMRDIASSPSNLFKECGGRFAKEGSEMPPEKEKPKRVRKSRAGASSATKRVTSDMALQINLEGASQPQLQPPKRRRPSANPGDGETIEKPPPRKRNRSRAKVKEEQSLSFSTNESSFGLSDPTSSKGIFGLYGLDTKSMDLSRYTKDISVESLMAGDTKLSSVSGKSGPPSHSIFDISFGPSSKSIFDNSFGSNFSSVLQNSTRPVITDQARPGLLFSKLPESRPHKLALDLECSRSEERLAIGLSESMASHMESFSPLLESRKAQETPLLFPLETISAMPPADFWNTLQTQPNVSLSSLLAQASTTTDSKFFPTEVGSNYKKSASIPPSIFSHGSSYRPRESSSDTVANSKLNQLFRVEPPKWGLAETMPHNAFTFSPGNMFPFKLDNASDPLLKPSERCGLKEGLLDIDLNKQSLEAEAAESIAYSSLDLPLPKPQVSHEVPTFTQAEVDGCHSLEEPICLPSSVCADAPMPSNEAPHICKIMSLPDCQHTLEVRVALQGDDEVAAEKSSKESVPAIVNKQHSTEQVKDISTNASIILPTLSVPEVPETLEMGSADLPYSPRMYATAHILCRMANSSSPIYVERDKDKTQVTECHDDAYMQWHTKAAKVSGLLDKEGKTRKPIALHESLSEEYAKEQAKDRKEKPMRSHLGSGNGLNTEPWASTPPRHAPKIVASRMSGSQSSESDRSPVHGRKEHQLRKDLSDSKKVQRNHHLGVATSFKVSSLYTRKDLKGNPKPAPKTSFLHTLPTKGFSVSLQQKRSSPVDTKQSLTAHGDGLAKVSRPRSNTSKNCLQRSTNGYPVQNGCSLKSPNRRHMLPYVGEVRHGSK